MDVYDGTAWSAVVPLSIESNKKTGAAMEFPDFTRGAWKSNAPLHMVDVDMAKLPLFEIRDDGAKQLSE